ncbi:MAG: 23S rRNA (adenine(2503)-C(2))-methyltransferase RlmN [Desulfobacteraceae bacterium]|nr:23S rRNA (adenine(2503)-C(2))-methyltransferase RlmN [Desulfobacteraceae bacterium]
MIDFRSLTRKGFEELAIEMGLKAYRGRQVFRWLWRPGLGGFSGISDLSAGMRERFSQAGYITRLKVIAERRSVDGTIKLGFGLADGLMVEGVLIPERGRRTLCVSTQVGCAMGCRFCHTAEMGFVRQLETSEIAGQVLSVIEHLGEGFRPKNLVFMGMGEPLANYENLIKAIDIISDDLGLGFSKRRITVSTCGLVPEMLRLGQEADVGLAISLHAPDDETRGEMMPVNRRYPLAQLMAACRAYPLSPRRRITFEYLLLAGMNDSIDHARKLAKLLRGIPSKINLILFNESPGLPFVAPSMDQAAAFQKVLMDAGYTVIIRKSKGQDIAAACGQLYVDMQGYASATQP